MARKEYEILNVSFLDVFACAIGAVLFIIIIVFLNSVGLSEKPANPSAAPDVETQRHEMEGLTRDLEDLEARLAERRRRNEDLAHQIQERATASAEARQQKEDLDEARSRLAAARAEEEQARARLEEDNRVAARAEAEADRLISGGANPGARAVGVVYRVPLERETSKSSGLLLECASGKAFLFEPDNFDMVCWLCPRDQGKIDRVNGLITKHGGLLTEECVREFKSVLERGKLSPNSDHTGWVWPAGWGSDFDQFGMTSKVIVFLERIRSKSARGDSSSEIESGQSRFQDRLSHLDRDQSYVTFVLRPSGFDAFKKARARLDTLGFEATWIYKEEDAFFGGWYSGSGGKSTVK